MASLVNTFLSKPIQFSMGGKSADGWHDVGPGVLKDLLNVTPALNQTLHEHNKYLANQSTWKQYLAWRYTMDSGAANAVRLGHSNPQEFVQWAHSFFQWYGYHPSTVERPFHTFRSFFESPQSYLDRPDKLAIAETLIPVYNGELQRLILEAPPVASDEGFYIYKATNPYPTLPRQEVLDKPIPVAQVPFNSTSYDPEFNYGQFLAGKTEWAILRLFLPKGSRVLSIDPSFHAYPHEREILLPPDCTFLFKKTEMIQMRYIPREDVQYEQVQDGPRFLVGEVFRPKVGYQPRILQRQMHLLTGIYQNPLSI